MVLCCVVWVESGWFLKDLFSIYKGISKVEDIIFLCNWGKLVLFWVKNSLSVLFECCLICFYI